MKLTFENDIHNTEIIVSPAETGVTKHNEPCATFTDKQLHTICKTLCGVSDCTCGGIRGNYCHDDNGKSYLVMLCS